MDNPDSILLPDIEGRLIASNRKWHGLPHQDRKVIQASRETAIKRFLNQVLQLDKKRPDELPPLSLLKYNPKNLKYYEQEIVEAVRRNDAPFFVRLGERLKKAKKTSRKVINDFATRIKSGKLEIFLIERWLPEPLFSDSLFWYLITSPCVRAEVEPEFLEALNTPLGYVCSAGLFQPVEKRRHSHCSPGLCFFSYGALTKVCRFFLQDHSITRDAIIKSVKRSGLKPCSKSELKFTHVEQRDDGTVFASPRR